ncbi:MAG: hypothetical protein ABR538_08395 [Candidatus Binatia bacterium]
MNDFKMTQRLAASLLAAALLAPAPAAATAITGTVTFQGNVVFDAPIPGITLADLTAASGPGIAATGNGEQCSIVTNGSAPVGIGGAYPDSGSLSVEMTIDRGGMNVPDGTCLLQLRATGNDGAAVSARGTVTVEVSVADIQGNAAIVVANDIVVRQSKTVAGLDKDCLKWVKKEVKFQGKCNYLLWKLGGAAGSLKCKVNDPEPVGCDPAAYAEEVLQLSFGQMNQQVDAPNADAVDLELLNDQSKCQRFLGKAGANFLIKRNILVQKRCVAALTDTDACRAQATKDARARLSLIDKCVTAQGTDVMSGLTLADVDEPCRAQCIAAGVLDRKCLKDCFEFEVSTLSDGLLGDVPACGDGVVSAGEACDDGNVVDGDCCSATCTAEPAGSQSCGVGFCEVTVDQCNAGEPLVCTPGAPGDEAANCADGTDNDCDGLIDMADAIDCP